MKIRRLLIANRGEIARRVIRTAHRMGIETVAVHSDADANALHVREATRAVALGGDASADTYLRIDKMLAAAKAGGADAIHPGYGFLSENADFAQAVADAGLVWVGPPAEATRAVGSKSRAKQLAHAQRIPCLPGYEGEDQTDERFASEAARIGFPVMVKASAGGGGRGMRLVTEASQLEAALHSARSEAQSAFGSGELLLERALLAPRHVEVQVFADAHGRCIHLGERDCSVQRRHQKIIEETPSPAVDAPLRERMGRCAIDLAQAAGYVGAGTVEFLLDGEQFFLMEMNTRLQVEHPVTEAVTGLDLVEWQLRVAQGEPLPVGRDGVRFEGHAIEVRLCAEDESFHPQAGRILQVREPGGVRFDHAIEAGMDVPPYYDSMLGKLIAHAPTRAEAIERLAEALDAMQVLGLPTNRQFLAACLRHPVFASGDARIPFLAQEGDAIRAGIAARESAVVAEAASAALIPAGPTVALALPFARPTRIRHRGVPHDVSRADASHAAGLPLGASHAETRPRTRHADARLGASHPHVQLNDKHWHVQIGAVDLFIEEASFDPPAASAAAGAANELRAPFNGKIVAVKAEPGKSVAKGDPLVVIESMKLEHSLAAMRDGIVRSIHVRAGQQAATSQVLVTLESA